MSLRRLASFGALLILTSVGCCSTQCVSSDPCNPCGGGISSGCCMTGWFSRQMCSWKMRHSCHNYSWCDECSGGCSACGCSSCDMGYSGDGMTMGAPSTCACGQSHATPTWPNAMPSPTPTPTLTPAPSPAPVPAMSPAVPNSSGPVAPETYEPVPAPASSGPTSFQPPVNGQTQHVSYEEFQRLPGVVVSGPGAQSSVPSMTQPSLSPPPLSNVSTPPRPVTPVQQAKWVPVR